MLGVNGEFYPGPFLLTERTVSDVDGHGAGMSLEKLQKNPIIFWASILMTIGSTVFAVWTYFQSKPTREISVYVRSSPIADLEKARGLGLEVQGEKATSGTISIVSIAIWNSGNQLIAEEDFLQPLRLSIDLDWREHTISYYGTDVSQIVGEPTEGMRFKSLFPGSGLRINFLSRKSPQVTLTGFLSGEAPGAGVVNVNERRWNFMIYLWGILAIPVLWLAYGAFRKELKAKKTNLLSLLVGSIIYVGFGLIIILLVAVVTATVYYNPPI